MSEFSRIVQSVASALIESGVSDEMAKSAEAERTQRPEVLSKSLSDTTTKADEPQKSLDAKATELETASAELEETKKSLAAKETELEKRNTRKAIVFDKFGTTQAVEKDDAKSAQDKAQKQWAGFITGGI